MKLSFSPYEVYNQFEETHYYEFNLIVLRFPAYRMQK